MVPRLRPLILAWFAAATAGVGAAANFPQNLVQPLKAALSTTWVVADFDGDRGDDLLVTGSAHTARGSCSYDVFGHLSARPRHKRAKAAFLRPSFTFTGRCVSLSLSAEDLDGDKDRDVVVEEALSGVPVAVWLNDGKGRFRKGVLAEYSPSGEWSSEPRLYRDPANPCDVSIIRVDGIDLAVHSVGFLPPQDTGAETDGELSGNPSARSGDIAQPRAPPAR